MSKAGLGNAELSKEGQTWARKAFVPAAIVFWALQAIGTVIAVANKLPYEVLGYGDPNTILRDFLMGNGTALSGPLTLQVILAVVVFFGRRHDRWGTFALVLTFLVGTTATIFGAMEPIAARMLQASPFGLYEAVVVFQSLGSVVASMAIAVLSILLVVRRVRNAAMFTRQPGSSQPI